MSDVDQHIREGLERLVDAPSVDDADLWRNLLARRRRRRRRKAMASVMSAALLVGIVLVGVDASDTGDESDVSTSDGGDERDDQGGDMHSPVIVAHPIGSIELARVVGRLERVGDCLFVRDDLGDRYAALWPAGTSWKPHPPTTERDGSVVTPDGATIALGEWFEAAGGWRDAGSLRNEEVGEGPRQRLTACARRTGGRILFPQDEFRASSHS